MASIREVAARVRAACEKGRQARSALERAEDLAEEAHDELARTLAGSTDPDVDPMLASFLAVKDGCKGYLWPLLNEAVKTTEGYADHLTTESAPPPAQPSQRPPTRQAEPTDPPVIPPERIERLRRELPPTVVPNTGHKTHGRWIGPDGTAQPIISGRDEHAKAADARLKGMGIPGPAAKTADVEIKLAARMVEEGIRHVTVIINNIPCVGRFGCDTLVPILLPAGATLTVHGTTEKGERFRKRYTGGARPWWR
ncbi:DddA-like double-stranded DNA deaminase toxin [Saccharothrix longispora]|uniref:DddA-like double-stranded DNA deaminase toxin n=1 Tax=Saccharothrix longispora TaxID=33920 RepID=UPI0028FDAD49|nr:DddA-like double-stranded DNA deaminase toxin [Saccharothrix longispora]MDU0288512.1 DddA-like double-stranded DNA deaminase toxin [Saccharothrix longispora]